MSNSEKDWLTSAEAAELLSCSIALFWSMPFKHDGLRHIPNCSGSRWLWYRPDLEELDNIRARCRIGFSGALRVLINLRNGSVPRNPASIYAPVAPPEEHESL